MRGGRGVPPGGVWHAQGGTPHGGTPPSSLVVFSKSRRSSTGNRAGVCKKGGGTPPGGRGVGGTEGGRGVGGTPPPQNCRAQGYPVPSRFSVPPVPEKHDDLIPIPVPGPLNQYKSRPRPKHKKEKIRQKYSFLQCLQYDHGCGKTDTRDRTGMEGSCGDAIGRPDLYGSSGRNDRGPEEAPAGGRCQEVERPEEKGVRFAVGD